MADPLAEGVYRWRVIAQDEALNTNPSEEGPSFRVDIQVAAAVLLRPPRFVGDRTPLFQWSHAGDETQPVTFTIQVIKTGDDFENGPFAINRDDLGTDLTFEPDDPPDVFDEQDYLWRVIAQDSANPPNVEISEEGLFTLSTLQPNPPVLLSPVNDTAELNTTFKWDPDGRAKLYTLVITADSDTLVYRIDDIPHVGDPGEEQEWMLLDAPLGGRSPLAPGALHHWTVRGKTTGGQDELAGGFAPVEAFITIGGTADLVIDVTLQGIGTGEDFEVRLYDAKAFRGPEHEANPWRFFVEQDQGDLRKVAEFSGVEGTADLQDDVTDFTIRIPGVSSGFYDITVESNTTLININDDVAVRGVPEVRFGMDVLLAGNAANDPRPGAELASIINALDASILVASFNTSETDPIFGNKRFDGRADFNRDGNVNQLDLDLLTANYLLFSPISVVIS